MKSMTGYGRAEYSVDGINLIVELKTVNNRNFDFNAKMPRIFISLEDAIRKCVNEYVKRGRVDLFINFADKRDNKPPVEVDFAKAEEFKSAHNLTYWNNEHYLGLGTAASYYIGDYRYTNINNIDKYFEAIDNNEFCYLEENDLVLGEKMFDEVVLGFRKLEGVSVVRFKEKFEKDIFEVYPVINELVEKGDIIFQNDYLRVPEEKIFVLNSILIKFLG